MRNETQSSAGKQLLEDEKRSLVKRALDVIFGFDFFISYTRRDGGKDYAEALVRRLEGAGFQIFFDNDDYAMGDDWRVQGKWALRRTGQLIVVASPEALSAPAVVREVEIYSSLPDRRIIPIDFGGTVRTRDETKPIFKYLKPEILFLEERPDRLGKEPSDDVVKKLRDGFNLTRQDKKRSRILGIVASVLVVLTILASLLAILAFSMTYRAKLAAANLRIKQTQLVDALKRADKGEQAAKIEAKNANEAKAAAQEALTRSFVRSIGVSIFGLGPDEPAALWELAELDPVNARVRETVIDHWFQSEESIKRAVKNQAQGLHAAVGLNVPVFNHSAQQANEMADRLANALENSQTDRYRIGDALATLAVGMKPEDAASVAHRLVQALEKETDSRHRSELGGALAALAARMEPKDAASVAARGAQVLAKALQQENGMFKMELAEALSALAARMEPKDAASVAARGAQVLAKALEKETDSRHRSELGGALAALAARMEPKDAASVAARGAQVLAKALEKETQFLNLSELGGALAALAAWMEPKDAASVAWRGAQVLAEALYRETDTYDLRALRRSLAILVARIEPKNITIVADSLAKGLENAKKTNADSTRKLGFVLTAFAGQMEPKDAASLAGRGAQLLAKALEKETGSDDLSKLSEALAAMATWMESKDAASVAGRGAKVLAKALEKETGSDDLSKLSEALAALAAWMEPKDAASVAARGAQVLAKALEKETDSRHLSELGEALAALAARMEPKDAASVAARGAQVLAKAWANPQDSDSRRQQPNLALALGGLSRLIPHASQTQLAALSNILLQEVPGPKQGEQEDEYRKQVADLYARLEPQELAEVLKWPFCVGEAQKIALSAMEVKLAAPEEKREPKFNGDLWKFVEQAPSLGIKDLDKPPQRPRIEDAIEELKELGAGAADKPSVPRAKKPTR